MTQRPPASNDPTRAPATPLPQTADDLDDVSLAPTISHHDRPTAKGHGASLDDTLSLRTLWRTLGIDESRALQHASHASLRDEAGLHGPNNTGGTIQPTAEQPQSKDIAALAGLRTWVVEAVLLGSERSAPAVVMPGQPVDLQLGSLIGEGGMGVVRSAHQVALGRDVAVKSLRAGEQRAEATLALLREAWVTGDLEHPNIVPVHALGRAPDGAPMLVMKRIVGKPWSDFIANPHLLPAEASADPLRWHLGVLQAACNAVAFAHSKRVLHRDLKPDNIMIGSFGEVYVLDWGLAVSLPGGNPRLPAAREIHSIAGTPHFMAPEMVEVRPDRIDERTDVYLLGAILHNLLTGQPRHRGRTPIEVLAAAWRSPEVTFSPAVPAELAAICNRATAADPGARHPSVQALRDAIAAYLQHRHSLEITRQTKAHLQRLRSLLDASALERGGGVAATPPDADDAAVEVDADTVGGDAQPQSMIDASIDSAPIRGGDPLATDTGGLRQARTDDDGLDGDTLSDATDLAVPTDSEERSTAIASAFAACRFGYQLALEGWADNDAARHGLHTALSWMLEHEIERGDLRAARALAHERGTVEPEIEARLQALQARLDAERAEALARERAMIDMDLRYGSRTRAFVAIIIAVVFGGLAVLSSFSNRMGWSEANHPTNFGIGLTFVAVLVALRLWARTTLTSTDFNRRVVRSLLQISAVNLVLICGVWTAGWPPISTVQLQQLLFGAFLATAGATLDTRITWASAGYLGTFVVAMLRPAWALEAMAVGHIASGAVIAWIWRPEKLKGDYAGNALALVRSRS